MTVYQPTPPDNTLLSGSSDAEGDTLTVRRIDGEVVETWPHTINLSPGTINIAEDGNIRYNDGGDTTEHPAVGVTQTIITITFTLWDGFDESSQRNCEIRLEGE